MLQACVDCLTPKPQWASVSFGTLLCLDCAGRHRGLGVHISFVRSVQMDAWKDAQIDAMKVRPALGRAAALAQARCLLRLPGQAVGLLPPR